uniref:Uncharacterized protein n=1 Tax=Chromera velia CCMP2878 TaxID=1169474 RepID=A0A0G4GXX3_9ALVE|eukprot:Cvel_23814.t1-p1 / transcript=Cvel_23814.t1 / gene=Cvel_23814 / organism=Chromera_velia_CCMP2878 / gene_product=hypothetical protein / transcript_product=hypothetical protein / location=Cvel_scaffold2501:18195-19850(-) / protein_length=552 / sequence_SO=supercontig / SO=protein_coding / is_pseudo=false
MGICCGKKSQPPSRSDVPGERSPTDTGQLRVEFNPATVTQVEMISVVSGDGNDNNGNATLSTMSASEFRKARIKSRPIWKVVFEGCRSGKCTMHFAGKNVPTWDIETDVDRGYVRAWPSHMLPSTLAEKEREKAKEKLPGIQMKIGKKAERMSSVFRGATFGSYELLHPSNILWVKKIVSKSSGAEAQGHCWFGERLADEGDPSGNVRFTCGLLNLFDKCEWRKSENKLFINETMAASVESDSEEPPGCPPDVVFALVLHQRFRPQLKAAMTSLQVSLSSVQTAPRNKKEKKKRRGSARPPADAANSPAAPPAGPRSPFISPAELPPAPPADGSADPNAMRLMSLDDRDGVLEGGVALPDLPGALPSPRSEQGSGDAGEGEGEGEEELDRATESDVALSDVEGGAPLVGPEGADDGLPPEDAAAEVRQRLSASRAAAVQHEEDEDDAEADEGSDHGRPRRADIARQPTRLESQLVLEGEASPSADDPGEQGGDQGGAQRGGGGGDPNAPPEEGPGLDRLPTAPTGTGIAGLSRATSVSAFPQDDDEENDEAS